MAKIREDLVGVVSVDGHNLTAGETVPDGVTVGDHVLAPEEVPEPALAEDGKPKRRTRKGDSEQEG